MVDQDDDIVENGREKSGCRIDIPYVVSIEKRPEYCGVMPWCSGEIDTSISAHGGYTRLSEI